MPRLTLTGLVKTYGAARALDGAALELCGGEVHALMGENGAGKSTLIKVLAGLERLDRGAVLLEGAVVPLGSPAAARALGLRFLHQELQVVPQVSVAENMHLSRRYPTRFGLVDWRALRAASAQALGQLGIGHIDPGAAMAALGPGDQMLVRIAATLIAEDGPAPWLYVMDEPTAALTGVEAARLFAVIGSLKAQGAGVLYVSHRMDEVMTLADRITVLRDGAHISTRARGETDQARLIHDMTGREMRDLYPARRGVVGGDLLEIAGLSAAGLASLGLTLRAGEVVGLAGLSGSGRNAALKALIGAVPRQGRVMLGGVALARNPAGAWAQGVAYVPRERRSEGLMMGTALGRNITLPHLGRVSRLGVLRHRHERGIVAGLSGEVRLRARGAEQAVAELSGGNQQKVLFARALAGAPRVLLLDEPTRGVDVGAKFDIYTLIRELSAKGVAVLIASSDLPELIGLCDRIAVLNAGHLTQIIPAEGLTEAALLARCYEAPTP